MSHLSTKQIHHCIPNIFEKLKNELGSNDFELALEVQSSLCIMGEMISELGRASPLAGMYTDEEEELLNQMGS